MPERSFRQYLQESLDRIAADAPRLYERIGALLRARALSIEVDGETVAVWIEAGRVVLGETRAPVAVRACTSRAEIVALADGTRTLEEATLAERVQLVGDIDDLLACLDALGAYLNGAVRSPELSALMDRFRGDVAES